MDNQEYIDLINNFIEEKINEYRHLIDKYIECIEKCQQSIALLENKNLNDNDLQDKITNEIKWYFIRKIDGDYDKRLKANKDRIKKCQEDYNKCIDSLNTYLNLNVKADDIKVCIG